MPQLPPEDAIACIPDKFRAVVECSDLYGNIVEARKALAWFDHLLRTAASDRQKADVALGLIYAHRNREIPETQEIEEKIRHLRLRWSDNDDLLAKIDIVAASIETFRNRNYNKSVELVTPWISLLARSNANFLYAVALRTLGCAHMYLGSHGLAEEMLGDAMAVFRRYGHTEEAAMTANDYAVLKKRICKYEEAEALLRKARAILLQTGRLDSLLRVHVNLGILAMKTGSSLSTTYLQKAFEYREKLLEGRESDQGDRELSPIVLSCCINYEHLLILRREFQLGEERLLLALQNFVHKPEMARLESLTHMYLGEVYAERRELKKAESSLERAARVAHRLLASSDVMTAVMRRRSFVLHLLGRSDDARNECLRCIRLSKRIVDLHEYGAAIRVLGAVLSSLGAMDKAGVCFARSVTVLRRIGAGYELMRSCIAYGEFLVDEGDRDAEIYLMEARQLCRKLEIDFFAAQIGVLLARHAVAIENFDEARGYLGEAEELYDGLQECDQKQLKPMIERATRELEGAVLKVSVSAAEQLKTICRVYEEARFPIEDIKPDLAYQVAQSVGGESLFLVRRHKRGYEVPLTFNIPVKAAKETVRRLDRNRKASLLGIGSDPAMFSLDGGRTLVAVPGSVADGYVLCTLFREQRTFSPRQLEFLFASAEAMERLAEDGELVKPTPGSDFIAENGGRPSHPRGSFKDILTIDPEMIKVIHLAERASRSEAPILLEGETGVGKELFARAIHLNSRRSDQPFVAINAGGLPVNLLESQLFGHVRGAFTDAVKDRVGLVEEARGGTIFFDEVGEMGDELQVKLLRLLENGEFRRLGENEVRTAEVRVVSATNRSLLGGVEKGMFRRDLYYRLSPVKLTIPPLRQRQRDIQLLIRHFLKECAARNRMFDRSFQIDVKAMEALELYDWPGNVRELQNEILRIVSLIGDMDVIRFGMLSETIKEYVKSKHRSEGLLEQSVERYERRLILEALDRNDWNRLRTAEEVGIPRTTLLAKMKRLNIAAR